MVREFVGSSFFRQRLILATLSGETVKITRIRQKDAHPGLSDYEISFLGLLEKLTNGAIIVIDETGTEVTYQPGLLLGGDFTHDCGKGRSISYFLEAIMCLAPFTKKPVTAFLRGITNDNMDPSVDSVKHTSLPILHKFLGTDDNLNLKINRRGLRPEGGGEVVFSCPCRQKLRPVKMTDAGQIRSIRGVAYACKVSPTMGNRVGEAAKARLKELLPDIYIYTDHCKGPKGGMSPGFGITLVAESTTGARYAVDVSSNAAGSSEGPSVPEDLGEKAAMMLLEEIIKGGCVDSSNQSLALLLMAVGQADVSKIQTGPLTPFTIQFLRYLKDFFGVTFRISSGGSLNDIERIDLTCVGIGYTNVSKTVS